MKEYAIARVDDLSNPVTRFVSKEKTINNWMKDFEGEPKYVKVVRNVGEWYKWEPPIDYSTTREEVDSLDHVIGSIDNGYVIHAFHLTDKLRDALVEHGYGRYYGYLRLGDRLRTFCTRVKSNTWRRQAILRRGDIIELENEKREGYNGMSMNSVCVECQRNVSQLREVA